MVLGALALYLVGVIASLTHHGVMSAVLYACGIALSAFAAWLSRGSDPHRPSPDSDAEPSSRPHRTPRAIIRCSTGRSLRASSGPTPGGASVVRRDALITLGQRARRAVSHRGRSR